MVPAPGARPLVGGELRQLGPQELAHLLPQRLGLGRQLVELEVEGGHRVLSVAGLAALEGGLALLQHRGGAFLGVLAAMGLARQRVDVLVGDLLALREHAGDRLLHAGERDAGAFSAICRGQLVGDPLDVGGRTSWFTIPIS